MMYVVDHIHHLMNESKMQSFAYNSDRRVYASLHMIEKLILQT